MSTNVHKLSFGEKLGYGCGDFASVLFWQTIMVYLLFFYTDIFGLTAAAAGIMFFISRILDAVFDVVIGMTADRTKTRWGKFRPYILWGAVPLAVSAVLAFSTPDFGETGKLIYAYITFILFMFLYSTVNIPYTALLGVISGDPVERTSASSFKFVGAYLAGFIVSATALPFASSFGGGNDAVGWRLTMIVYAVAAVVFFAITFLSTRERIQPILKEKTSVKNDLNDISKNIPWLLLFAVTILFILFVCIRLSVTAHYFKYYIGEQESIWLTNFINGFIKYVINPVGGIFSAQPFNILPSDHKFGIEVLASAFNTIGQAFSLIGVLLVPWIAKIMGRKKGAILLLVTAIISTSLFYIIKPQDLGWLFFLQVIGSVSGGPVSALLWVMYADTADYSEWKTGRRATGLVFSASIMSNKIGWAIGSMIAGLILAGTGFVANMVQTVEVQQGLVAMMSIIPGAVGAAALLLLIFFYKLDEPTMEKVKAELEKKRKESGEEPVTA